MTPNPYAIPVEELVGSARVPVEQLAEIQAEPRPRPADWSTGLVLCADGPSGDADGD
jgi:hypothetical protein